MDQESAILEEEEETLENTGKYVSQRELFLLKELPKQMKTTTTLVELIELMRNNSFGSSKEGVEENVMLAFVTGYNDGAPQRRPKQQQQKKTTLFFDIGSMLLTECGVANAAFDATAHSDCNTSVCAYYSVAQKRIRSNKEERRYMNVGMFQCNICLEEIAEGINRKQSTSTNCCHKLFHDHCLKQMEECIQQGCPPFCPNCRDLMAWTGRHRQPNLNTKYCGEGDMIQANPRSPSIV